MIRTATAIAKGRRLLDAVSGRWHGDGRAPADGVGAGAPQPGSATTRRIPFAALVLGSLATCGLVSLLPSTGPLVPLKFAAATFGVLVLPGAVILRLLGWPRSPAAALPGCAVWSVTALAPGFGLMLLLDRGPVVAVLWLLLVVGVGLLLGRGKPVEVDLPPLSPSVLVLAGGIVGFSALLWLGSWPNIGDAVEHIARMRKIGELDPPRSLDELGLLPPGTGLHPGYAFPLWHATGAVVAWLSGLEETFVFRYWPSLLIVFVAAAMYRAGRVMFGCAAAGVAACVAYLGVFAFPFGAGFFSQLSYPGYISIFLFWPLVIERTFTYLREGGREPVWTAAAASFAVTAIHPSYAPFMILLIGAFLVARTLLVRDRGDFRRLATMVGALTVPFLLFLVWLYPTADSAAATVSRGSDHFGTLVNTSGDLVSMKPEWVARGGPAAIAALLLVPLASAATRTRAGAFIAGTSAVVILILIVPWFFTPFAEVVSVSQGRRFLFYLPWAFALTGGALVLARFRWFAVAGALVLGVLLQEIWPGERGYKLVHPGPGWLAWFAGVGALVVLAVGAVRRLDVRYGNWWALPIVVTFVLPLAVTGVRDMQVNRSEPVFSGPLLAALREHVDRDDVLMAEERLAYRLTARVPIYIVAVSGGHGGNTVVNRQSERRRAVKRFFGAETAAEAENIVDTWEVQWVLVANDEPFPSEFLARFTPVFEGNNYTLYPVDPAVVARIDESRAS